MVVSSIFTVPFPVSSLTAPKVLQTWDSYVVQAAPSTMGIFADGLLHDTSPARDCDPQDEAVLRGVIVKL